MREGWTYKKLGEVAKLINGFAFQSAMFQKAGLPIVRISNIQDDKITSDFVYFNRDDYNIDFEKFEVLYGDILIAMSGATTGKVGINYNDEVLYLNQRVGKIVPRENVIQRYLFYYLKTNAAKSLSIAQGVAQPNLSTQQINSFVLPVPPLSEQQRIVSELDLLSSIIEKKKAQLKEYDQLAQSIFYDMFGDPVTNEKGWEVKKLGDVCEKITDGTHNSPVNTETGDYMYVTAKNIKKDGITLDNITYVSAKVHKTIYERCNPKFGDVLYIKDGITTGVATINTLKEEFSLLSSVALLKPQKCLINHYLKAVLNMPSQYASIRENMGGAAITRLTIAKINQIIIPLPPLPLQQSFASKIEAIEHQKALVQQSIAETESLFNSRMDYYFD